MISQRRFQAYKSPKWCRDCPAPRSQILRVEPPGTTILLFGPDKLIPVVRKQIPGGFFQEQITRIGVQEKRLRIDPDFVVREKRKTVHDQANDQGALAGPTRTDQ